MVIHQYDKRKNNKTEGARAKLKEYIEKGKELKKAAEEEEKEEHQEEELIFTLDDLKELDEDEEKKEESNSETLFHNVSSSEPKKEEPKIEIKEEPKEDFKARYEALQKEHEDLKRNPRIVIKSDKEAHADLLRSKLRAMFQSPHK